MYKEKYEVKPNGAKSSVQLLMADQTPKGIKKKKEFTGTQEHIIRRMINGFWPSLFPYVPFSPIEVSGNEKSHNDLRNKPFFIEVKSTSKLNLSTYGYDFDAEKLKRMVDQAYTNYLKDGVKRDILFALQILKSEKKFKLYLFNLTHTFDLTHLRIQPFNQSKDDWPWKGTERLYVDKDHLERFKSKTYKVKLSQGRLIFDNTYEMGGK